MPIETTLVQETIADEMEILVNQAEEEAITEIQDMAIPVTVVVADMALVSLLQAVPVMVGPVFLHVLRAPTLPLRILRALIHQGRHALCLRRRIYILKELSIYRAISTTPALSLAAM